MQKQDATTSEAPLSHEKQSRSNYSRKDETTTPRRTLKYGTDRERSTELCGPESPFRFQTKPMQGAERTRPSSARRAAKTTSRNVSPLEGLRPRPNSSAASCTTGKIPASTDTTARTAEQQPVSSKRRAPDSPNSDLDRASCVEPDINIADIEDGLRSCQLLSKKYSVIAEEFYSKLAWCSDETRSPLKVPRLSAEPSSWAGPNFDSSDEEKENIPAHYGTGDLHSRSSSRPGTPLSSQPGAQMPPQPLAESSADSHGPRTPEEQIKKQVPNEPSPAHEFPASHPTGPRSDSEDSLASSPRAAHTEPGSGVEASPSGSPNAAITEPWGEVLQSLVVWPKPLPEELHADQAATPVVEAASTLTKSAGKLRLVHLLQEGPLAAAAASTSSCNLKAILATLGKLALLLAVLGFAWQSRNFIGTQCAVTPMGLDSSIFTFPAFSQQIWSLAGIKAALPDAASLQASPSRASKAASSPRAEPAPVDSTAKQDPVAGHQPASLWAEVTRTVKAAIPSTTPETPAVATLPAASKTDSIPARPMAAKPAETPVHSSEPAAAMGSCPAQDLRAVQYTAAVGTALLTVMVIWSFARCMVPAGNSEEDGLEEPCAMLEEVVEVGPPTATRRSPARALPLIQEEPTPNDEETPDPEPGAVPAISASIKTALRSSSRLAASIARSVTGSQKPVNENNEDEGEVSSAAQNKTARKTRSASARKPTAHQVPEASAAAAVKSLSKTTSRRSSRLRQAAP